MMMMLAATPGTTPSAELRTLLVKNRDMYDISWSPPHAPPGTFQDHIPYDLVAQYQLGATGEQLEKTFKYHESTEMLQPSIASSGTITLANWRDHIGMVNGNPSPLNSDYLSFYREQLLLLGVNGTLHTFLPTLVEGLFGKLYHGLQTLGFGYMNTMVEDMVAQGLSWMSTAHSPPAPLNLKPVATNLTKVLIDMHADNRLPHFSGDATFLYYEFLAALVANFSHVLGEYDLLIDSSAPLSYSLTLAEAMSDSLFQLFSATNCSSYTNVHHLASVHATARVLPYLPTAADRAQLLKRQWQAIVYNFAIQGRAAMTMPPVSTARSWEDIVAGARKQGDVHLHELVYYASRDPHSISDSRRRQSADRALALFEGGGKWGF